MSYPEEVAKTKWCPFVRLSSGVGHVSWNRRTNPSWKEEEPEVHPEAMCIGSRCMMWEWTWAGEMGKCGLSNE